MVEFQEDGRRRRVFRESELKALEYANVLTGRMGPSTPNDKDYKRAEQILHQVGMGGKILDVVFEWISMNGVKERPESVMTGITIDELSLIDAKKELDGTIRPRTARSYALLLKRFREQFGQTPISRLTPDDINEWLDNATTVMDGVIVPVSLKTRAHYWSTSIKVLRHAAEKGLLRRFDFTRIKKPRFRRKTTVDFYTLDELRMILDGLVRHPEFDLLGYVVLGLFCGLRSEEICDPGGDKPALMWRHINFDERSISLDSRIDKKGYRRFIQNAPDVAWAWLELARKDDGPVAPQGLRRKVRKFFKKIGVAFRPNGLRYSCATYYANGTQSEHMTAALLRHQGTGMLLQRYLGHENPQGYMATKARGEEFLRLLPPPL